MFKAVALVIIMMLLLLTVAQPINEVSAGRRRRPLNLGIDLGDTSSSSPQSKNDKYSMPDVTWCNYSLFVFDGHHVLLQGRFGDTRVVRYNG